ncbi:MAG: lysophospholipid acyltransferase family protein [Desulfobulbaceae bacterium]|nr:lysophospholipid acyltransferase family protein [Desulfobulbaceae bacterium]
MTEGKLNDLLLRIVPWIFAWLMRLWFRSCRVTLHNQENCFGSEEKDKMGIASFWHYSIIYILYHMRKYSATAMVSASRDGDYLARLAEELDFDTVRGSRNNKGVEGLKAMLRAIRKGNSAAIVADGSQGPPRIVQPGAILLASRTAAPIIPMVFAASNYFTINSWDRTIIPKPFSRIDFYYGEPIFISAKLTPEEIEEHRLQLDERLNELYAKAWGRYDKIAH